MLPKTDNDLIQRYVKDGDNKAFDELYLRYKPQVQAWVRKRFPKDQAEDLEQAIWERIFPNLHQYSLDRPFKPWLFAVCRNTSINWLRETHVRFDWEIDRDLYKGMVQDFIESEGKLIRSLIYEKLDRLSPKEEADTLFQNIVHILTSNSFHKLRNVETVDQVEATVLRETRKALWEYLKQKGTHVVVPIDSPEMETVAKGLQSAKPGPEDKFMQEEHLREQLERFRAIMREELTGDGQIVIKLRLLEGWETREIAEFFRQVLKRPMEDNNVNIIFYRAKTKLAKRLVKDVRYAHRRLRLTVQEEQLDPDSELMRRIVQGRLEERKSLNALSDELNRCASEIEELYKRFIKKFANYLEELFAEFPPLLAETGGDQL